MRDSESSADITRSDSLVSHLHDPLPHYIWQWPAVDEDSPKLVDSAVTWNTINRQADH